MQNGVLFGILMTLLNKRRVKRRFLAEKFEVSERTIDRYVDVLGESGVPIISYRGVNGGYSIADDYTLDKNYLTGEELERTVTCLGAMQNEFNDHINVDIIDKLSNLAHGKHEDKYLLRSESLIIDTGAWTNPQQYRSKIETVKQAINEMRTLHMRYTDNKSFVTNRDIDPYTLALKEGVWYVFGYCHYRHECRLFRLARMQSLFITDKTFERRPCDVYEKLHGNFDDRDLVDIEFTFHSTVLSDVEEWLGADAISERGTQYVAKASLYGGKMLIDKLLSFGSSICIISPEQLKEEMLIECKRILRTYGY